MEINNVLTFQFERRHKDVVVVPQGLNQLALPHNDRQHRHPGQGHTRRVGAGCQDDGDFHAPGRQQEGGGKVEKSKQENRFLSGV